MRLTNYLCDNDLNESLQSAYKKHHSCETALLRVQNDILKAIDDKQCVILLLLDLSAAFDTVDHKILEDVSINNEYEYENDFKPYSYSKSFSQLSMLAMTPSSSL